MELQTPAFYGWSGRRLSKLVKCPVHEVIWHFLLLPICGKVFFKEMILNSLWHSFWPFKNRMKYLTMPACSVCWYLSRFASRHRTIRVRRLKECPAQGWAAVGLSVDTAGPLPLLVFWIQFIIYCPSATWTTSQTFSPVSITLSHPSQI